MTWIPDMDKGSFCDGGDHLRAIGWLHPDHPFPRGTVPEAFLVRLREFERLVYESMEVLNWRGGLGDHECEFCPPSETLPDGRVLGAVWGHGQFGVPHGDILFGAPPMIVHYVEAHQYQPPQEFVTAVLASPLPDSAEYRDAIQRYLPRPRP